MKELMTLAGASGFMWFLLFPLGETARPLRRLLWSVFMLGTAALLFKSVAVPH